MGAYFIRLSKKSALSGFFNIIKPEVINILKKAKPERNTLEIVSVEGLVPHDHLLRKIDSAVDFTHIYDFVEDLYWTDNGHLSVDPIVLFKMVLIQHLCGVLWRKSA